MIARANIKAKRLCDLRVQDQERMREHRARMRQRLNRCWDLLEIGAKIGGGAGRRNPVLR